MVLRIATALVLLISGGGVLAQGSFPDVPPGHWAEEAVERIADLGIVIGFPDGTFQGNTVLTRYQAALMIERLLGVVAADEEALRAALGEELDALRSAVRRLADENTELRRRLRLHRDALETLHTELSVLRQELGLPPPMPLPPLAEPLAPERAAPILPETPGLQEEAQPAEDDAMATDDGAADGAGPEPVPDEPAPSDRPGEAPADTPAAAAERAPADEALEEPEARDLAPAADVPRAYVALGLGGTVPTRVLVRATVGADDLGAPGFGARLSVDLGRRSAAPLASVAVMVHGTYRVVEVERFELHAGAGTGAQLAGEGAFASVLGSAAWTVEEPLQLFAEATLDVYLSDTLQSGGPRVSPTLLVGGRWRF